MKMLLRTTVVLILQLSLAEVNFAAGNEKQFKHQGWSSVSVKTVDYSVLDPITFNFETHDKNLKCTKIDTTTNLYFLLCHIGTQHDKWIIRDYWCQQTTIL